MEEPHYTLTNQLSADEKCRVEKGLLIAAAAREQLGQGGMLRRMSYDRMHGVHLESSIAQTRENITKWVNIISNDVNTVDELRRQCVDGAQKVAVLAVELRCIRADAQQRSILIPNDGSQAALRVASQRWHMAECNELEKINGLRVHVGLPPGHYAPPDPRLRCIQETHRHAETSNAVVGELASVFGEFGTRYAPLSGILELARQYQQIVVMDMRAIPADLNASYLAFVEAKTQIIKETRSTLGRWAEGVRFTKDEIGAIMLRCNHQTKRLLIEAPTEYARYAVERQAIDRQLAEFMREAIRKVVECQDPLMVQMEEEQPPPSRFVLVTYDPACSTLTTHTLPSSLRVWSVALESIKCSYIEYQTAQPFAASFMDCVGVKLKAIHGCPALVMGADGISKHPGMSHIVQACYSMHPSFLFTSASPEVTMMEPPYALEADTRNAVFGKQLTMAKFAHDAINHIKGFTSDEAYQEHQRVYDATTRVLRALQAMRGVQVVVHSRLLDETRELEVQQLQLQRRIAAIKRKL